MPAESHASALHALMVPHRQRITDGIVEKLRGSRSEHYPKLEEGVLENRAAVLVDSFLKSLADTPETFVGYMADVARQRIGEGFHLDEIQTALGILEELAWEPVAEGEPSAEQVRRLARITGIIGAAKDRMAQVFLEQWTDAENRTRRLQRRLDELSRGTDPGTVFVDDDPVK